MRSQGYHFFSANQTRHTITGLAIHEKVHRDLSLRDQLHEVEEQRL